MRGANQGQSKTEAKMGGHIRSGEVFLSDNHKIMRDGIRAMTTTPTRLMVSKELIGDRLLCMLEHIRCGRAEQVLLHAILFANVLSFACPGAQKLRDAVQEAQALFMRGKRHLAEQRLEEAVPFWTGRTHRVMAARA